MPTRKEFLQTLGGLAASAALSKLAPGEPLPLQAEQSSAMATHSHEPRRVRRAVTLYCYQDEYKLREMSLEDCIAAVADTGADGIEILGEESAPNFPSPSEQFVKHWQELMAKYQTKPVCYDAFLEMRLLDSRPM